MKYQELVKNILENIGGKENINSLTHCVTRLRFKLKDEGKADTEKIKKIKGVVTVVQSGGQYQVVIGNHVPDVYKEFVDFAGLPTDESPAAEAEASGLFNKFIDVISSVFTPVLSLLAATGMIKGVNVLLVSLGWISADSGTYAILQAAGDCFFYFFPIFLGYTAAKKFGLKPFVGMALGAALVYPAIGNLTANREPLYTLFSGTLFESPVYVTFFGIPVILMSYSSSVIPIVISTFFGAKVEKFLKKIMPSVVRNFLVPFFTVLIMVPLTFIIIGPVTTWMGNLLGEATLAIYNLSPIFAGLVMGGIWQVLVMFGLHWGMVPIALNNIAMLGYDPLLALSSTTPFATAGAVLAVVIRSRNTNVREIGIPAFISSLFGVSEPSLYGITLPRKKPFFATLFSSAIGGVLMGLFGAKNYVMGGMGIFSFPNYINPETGIDMGFYGAIIARAVAFALCFALVMTIAYDPKADREAEAAESPEADQPLEVKKDLLETADLTAPIKGDVLPLSAIKDNAFSEGLLGKGIAIEPTEGAVYAVADGVVETLFPTKHAIGLKYDNGVEMLIHIGMDTVNLQGEFFDAKVAQGDRVTKGQLLLTFEREKIKEAGYSLTTPVVITNTNQYLDVIAPEAGEKNDPDVVLSVIK